MTRPPCCHGCVFQSTRPRGARRAFFTIDGDLLNVSIHAPARGATQILEHAAVADFKEFVRPNINRVYLTLTGYSARFNGDRNTRVYFDRKTQKIMLEMGKGICSSEFNASLTALETFGVSRVN